MDREIGVWMVGLVLLLTAGVFVGQMFVKSPGEVARADGDAFRAWFWERRGLDLAAQVGLIFVGALGIAAVLPRAREKES